MADAVMNGAMMTKARIYFTVLPPSLDSSAKQIRDFGKRHDGDQANRSVVLILIQGSSYPQTFPVNAVARTRQKSFLARVRWRISGTFCRTLRSTPRAGSYFGSGAS